MAILVERVRKVPQGRGQLLMWRALGSLSSFAWSFLGAALGLWVGGLVAYVIGGDYLTVMGLTGAMGVVGGGIGIGMGWVVRHLATSGCERCQRRIRWVTRYGWPGWLKVASSVAIVGVAVSLWGLTTIY
jgi:hypothetical protein